MAATTRRRRNSAIEIILSSHLATELFGMEHDDKKKKKKAPVGGGNNSSRAVATMLSRYCMYLVAHTPELLPDDEVWASWRLRDMRTCLQAGVLPKCCSRGCMLLYRCYQDDTMPQLLRRKRHRLHDSTAGDAVEMLEKIKGWDELARFWVQLLVYLAPSNDVQGHDKAVAASGGDLISCLWALCTHAGIIRKNE